MIVPSLVRINTRKTHNVVVAYMHKLCVYYKLFTNSDMCNLTLFVKIIRTTNRSALSQPELLSYVASHFV